MPSGTDHHTLELVWEDGTRQTVETDEEATILEATDDADIDLRHGCRKGECVSCTGPLLDGDVEYDREPAALNDEQRREGFGLLCIARPTTDCRVEL
ncbi:2Fe-2S iron-sulfur cluster-binding protein [Haloarculaceae archaeon H-GB2-1]|nr:2Fe-2S iron-sulfur cluster-binding protein [Haloarculaceae archaeon H-GB1-1]MEA5387613.1 2Fe-2S iron-sulfur cluster-binding protein [Haloarculaceae archaeon H-GB11]MEA5409101.1 2Fe-2S iron-sulfur cluster-binding protein [Haloarculaceae archaeon H-GB2-1]